MPKDSQNNASEFNNGWLNPSNIAIFWVSIAALSLIAGGLYSFYRVFHNLSVKKWEPAVNLKIDDRAGFFSDQFSLYPDLMYPILVGVVCVGFGYILLKGIIRASSKVIPAEDKQLLHNLIENGNVAGVDQYVRLSSLAGSTGFFTQMGFTGLPLATIGITLILVFLSILNPEDGKLNEDLLDMAKLTLGAFIGSFVQRKIGDDSPVLDDPNVPLQTEVMDAPLENANVEAGNVEKNTQEG